MKTLSLELMVNYPILQGKNNFFGISIINKLIEIMDLKFMFAAHYELIKERGLIEPLTSIDEFIDKAIEEMNEIKEAKHQNDPNLPNEFMDLMCVCAHFIQFMGYDLEYLLRNNIKEQVKKLNNGK